MSGAAFLRIKRLAESGIITKAARHNKREIQAEMGAAGSIDPTRTHLNYPLAGPTAACDVAQFAKDLMTAAGVKPLRKDAVMGLELVFSLPPGHAIDERDYFTACMTWAGMYFAGAQNILSCDVHKDEAQAHCHILILPLVNGRMVGSDLHGGKTKLLAMQKHFYENVASKFGLSKARARLTGATKQAATKGVLQRLQETGDSALQSAAWQSIRDAIENDPAPYLLTLGIELQTEKKQGRTMVQIFTSKGKGRAVESSNPIGFASPKKEQTLCSVGFVPKPAPVSSPMPEPQAPKEVREVDKDTDLVRIKDKDLNPAMFDQERGEYFQPPPPATRQQRQDADDWVKASLLNKTCKRASEQIGAKRVK